MGTFGRLVLGLAVALAAGWTAAGEPQQAPQTKDCDLSKKVKGFWCDKCGAEAPKAEVKEKKHTKCDSEVKEIEFCVKACYKSSCHPDAKTDKPVCPVCKMKIDKPSEDRARILIKCDKCGKEAEKEGACKEEGCKGKVKKICEQNGRWPHGGEPPKSDNRSMPKKKP